MRLLNTLKSLKILLVIFLMTIGTSLNANIEPTDRDKTDNKEQLQSEQIEQDKDSNTGTTNNEKIESEGTSDDDAGSISNSSFNYFFYLIYKIKFADIFNLPNRNSENNQSAVPTVNINSLLEKLTNPKI